MSSIRGRKAFTLIELIIVIVIIGILAGIAVIGYQAVAVRTAHADVSPTTIAVEVEVGSPPTVVAVTLPSTT